MNVCIHYMYVDKERSQEHQKPLAVVWVCYQTVSHEKATSLTAYLLSYLSLALFVWLFFIVINNIHNF